MLRLCVVFSVALAFIGCSHVVDHVNKTSDGIIYSLDSAYTYSCGDTAWLFPGMHTVELSRALFQSHSLVIVTEVQPDAQCYLRFDNAVYPLCSKDSLYRVQKLDGVVTFFMDDELQILLQTNADTISIELFALSDSAVTINHTSITLGE